MTDLRSAVFEALDNAKENGHDFTHEFPHGVACDLIDYDADLEECMPDMLIPHIKAWQDDQRGGGQ